MYLTTNIAPQPSSPEQILDLHRILRIGRRHFRLMAIIFLITLALTAAMTLRAKPVYTASLQLMIDKPSSQPLARNETQALSQSALDASTIETEVEVLHSPGLAEAVARELRLDRDPEFNPA